MELFPTEIEKSLDGLGFLVGAGSGAVDKGEVETRNSGLEMLSFRYLLDIHMILGRQLDIQVWIGKRCLS